jgi:hypothetical protein
MSNINKLLEEANAEENDLAYIGKIKKYNRAKRESDFERDYAEKLKEIGFSPVGDKWTNGVVDYYPKSDRLLIRKGNIWKKHGLNYLKGMM